MSGPLSGEGRHTIASLLRAGRPVRACVFAGLVTVSFTMAACTADPSGDSMTGSSAEGQPDPMAVRPFTIDIPDDVLTDLRDRLSRTRLPEESPGTGWDQGANRAYVAELLAYWEDEFDWRAQERRLNEPPDATVNVDVLMTSMLDSVAPFASMPPTTACSTRWKA